MGLLGPLRSRTKNISTSLYIAASYTIPTEDQLICCPGGKKPQLFIYLTFTLRRPSYPRRIKTECSKSPWCVNLRFLLEHSSSFSTLFLESSFYSLGIIFNPDNPQNKASKPETSR